MRRTGLLLTAMSFSSLLCSCGGASGGGSSIPPPPSDSGYFPYVQGWLGANGAYSVPLGRGQIFFMYVCNSTQASDVTNNMNLYHPVVVTQALPNM